MLLVDFSQICMSNLMHNQKSLVHKGGDLEADLYKHMVLNTLRRITNKFKSKDTEVVIACDAQNNWRKDEFPYYKAKRKDFRKKQEFDWDQVYKAINELKEGLYENFPYHVIEVDRTEADDVIGTLVQNISDYYNVLIISGDKDFAQLQKYPGVTQYDPTKDRWIKEDNPDGFLKEHIFQGDVSDGIPNFLSPDSTFVDENLRQKPIQKKKLNRWLFMDIDDIVEEEGIQEAKIGYERNEKLIDLMNTPQDLQNLILREYKKPQQGDKMKAMMWLNQNNMRNLANSIEQF